MLNRAPKANYFPYPFTDSRILVIRGALTLLANRAYSTQSIKLPYKAQTESIVQTLYACVTSALHK